MTVEVSWEPCDEGARLTCRLGDRTFTRTCWGEHRSPYNPFVIQFYRSFLGRWDSGRGMTGSEMLALEEAIRANPPGTDFEYRTDR